MDDAPLKSLQNMKEKILVAERMKGFDIEKSKAVTLLNELFGSIPKREYLISMARALSDYTKIPLDREASRIKQVCIKWIDENYEVFEPIMKDRMKIKYEK